MIDPRPHLAALTPPYRMEYVFPGGTGRGDWMHVPAHMALDMAHRSGGGPAHWWRVVDRRGVVVGDVRDYVERREQLEREADNDG